MPRNPGLIGLSDAQRKQRAQAKAKARKQRFDARMRYGEDAQNPERRHAVVVYLTEDAKQVLRLHRQRSKQNDARPVLNSMLIEALLIDYGQRQNLDPIAPLMLAKAPVDQDAGATPEQTCEEMSRQIHALELRHLVSQNTINELRARIAHRNYDQDDKDDDFYFHVAEDEILDRHRRFFPTFGLRLAQELRASLAKAPNDTQAARIVGEAFVQHILDLVIVN